MVKTYYDYQDSPIGRLLLAGDGEALTVIGFPSGKGQRRHQSGWQRDEAPLVDAKRQLSAYFAGELQEFDLPLKPEGTEFQRRVWAALRKIPFGETWSYGQLANELGNPKASRAVGAANGKNPIPIIIPCHRVIGSTGKLTGFGGGLATKEYLLDMEAQQRAPQLPFG